MQFLPQNRKSLQTEVLHTKKSGFSGNVSRKKAFFSEVGRFFSPIPRHRQNNRRQNLHFPVFWRFALVFLQILAARTQ